MGYDTNQLDESNTFYEACRNDETYTMSSEVCPWVSVYPEWLISDTNYKFVAKRSLTDNFKDMNIGDVFSFRPSCWTLDRQICIGIDSGYELVIGEPEPIEETQEESANNNTTIFGLTTACVTLFTVALAF